MKKRICPCGCKMPLSPIMPGKNRWKGDVYRQYMTKEYLSTHLDMGIKWISDTFGCKWDFVARTSDSFGINRTSYSKVKKHRVFDVGACKSFIDGLLMGDASLRTKKSRTIFNQQTISYEWCQEIKRRLQDLGIQTRVANDIRKNKNDGYGYRTLAYVNFIYFHRRWYTEDGTRLIPNDIEISNDFIRNWVFSDGTKSSGGLVLCSERFMENHQKELVKKINSTLKTRAYTIPHIGKTRIRFPANSMPTIKKACHPILGDMAHKFGDKS